MRPRTFSPWAFSPGHDSVLPLSELNPCGAGANNDLNGEFSAFAGEIFVSRDGGRSWEKRIEAVTGDVEWLLATPTRLWIAGSHVQETLGEAKIRGGDDGGMGLGSPSPIA